MSAVLRRSVRALVTTVALAGLGGAMATAVPASSAQLTADLVVIGRPRFVDRLPR